MSASKLDYFFFFIWRKTIIIQTKILSYNHNTNQFEKKKEKTPGWGCSFSSSVVPKFLVKQTFISSECFSGTSCTLKHLIEKCFKRYKRPHVLRTNYHGFRKSPEFGNPCSCYHPSPTLQQIRGRMQVKVVRLTKRHNANASSHDLSHQYHYHLHTNCVRTCAHTHIHDTNINPYVSYKYLKHVI